MPRAMCVSGLSDGSHKNKPAMKKTFAAPILNQPITELEISEEFKKLTLKYRYQTLGDILNLPKPYGLLQHEGFNYRLLMEFTETLTKNGLGHYLMPV